MYIFNYYLKEPGPGAVVLIGGDCLSSVSLHPLLDRIPFLPKTSASLPISSQAQGIGVDRRHNFSAWSRAQLPFLLVWG